MPRHNHCLVTYPQDINIRDHFDRCVMTGMATVYARTGNDFLHAFIREPMTPEERSAEIAFIVKQMEAAR
jgi:hypothetical protein